MGVGISGQDKTYQGYTPLRLAHGISPLTSAYSTLLELIRLTEVAQDKHQRSDWTAVRR
jgi:hypothetical protein